MNILKHFAIHVTFSLSFFSLQTEAATVAFTVNNISGNTWEYQYTVTNDTLGSSLEELTIYFDATLFENLSLPSAPVDWDPIVIQPDLFIPDDGFYDALALVSGIAAGDTLGGFSLLVDYLGAGVPGAQFFEVVDPFTFTVLESGMTSPVPLPPAALLFLSGLGLLGLWRKRITD